MVVVYSPLIEQPIQFTLYPAEQILEMLGSTLNVPGGSLWIVPGTGDLDE